MIRWEQRKSIQRAVPICRERAFCAKSFLLPPPCACMYLYDTCGSLLLGRERALVGFARGKKALECHT